MSEGELPQFQVYISRWTDTSHILIGLTNLQRRYGSNTWLECNDRMENAKLVHLPGAVNCAGGADLAKCSQHYTS